MRTGPLVAYLDSRGEGLDVREILTLDRRGFSAYRTRRRRSFELVLDRG